MQTEPKFKVGELVKWEGLTVGILAVDKRPDGYLYWVSYSIVNTYGDYFSEESELSYAEG